MIMCGYKSDGNMFRREPSIFPPGFGVVSSSTISSAWSTNAVNSAGPGPPGSGGSATPDSGSVDSKNNLDVGDCDDDKDLAAADAEGVWSPDIEQSFQEALAIYPPCGRRKIILSDEGKMYEMSSASKMVPEEVAGSSRGVRKCSSGGGVRASTSRKNGNMSLAINAVAPVLNKMYVIRTLDIIENRDAVRVVARLRDEEKGNFLMIYLPANIAMQYLADQEGFEEHYKALEIIEFSADNVVEAVNMLTLEDIGAKIKQEMEEAIDPIPEDISTVDVPEEYRHRRNELIARYIKLRTGKTRTRKQVSSHIQVLARRKLREIQAKLKVVVPSDSAVKEKTLQSMSTLSSAQIVSATAIHNKATAASLASLGIASSAVSYTAPAFWQPGLQPGTSQDIKPFAQGPYTASAAGKPATAVSADLQPPPTLPPWEGRAIATHKLRLVEFSAFMEHQTEPDTFQKHLFVHIGGTVTYSDPLLEAVDARQIYDKFPEKKGGLKELYDRGPQNAFFLVKFWADLNSNIQDESGAFYGVTSQYESNENMTITCSTKVCSFGKQVVEKVETEYARFENGRFVYRIHRSPMCEYMINFIHKLKCLPEKYMMNSVLENFTILQVVTNRETQETLLCTAYVFEVSTSEHGAQHHIYRLITE